MWLPVLRIICCPLQIAIVFEFTGALVLGRVSQETISGGIADVSAFQTDPEFYAYGQSQIGPKLGQIRCFISVR